MEKLLPLAVAVEQATGRRPHLVTCLRWCSRGSRGVRLESSVLGGRRLTSVDAVQRFMDAVTAVSDYSQPPQRPATPKTRAKQIAAAEKTLSDLGV